MAEIILPPEENEETPQAPELNIDKPTKNSKVITIEFEAKKTNKISTKDTNQQLYTTDTDAWFEFKETTLENANGTYSVVFRNRHDGSIFQRTGDVVNGVAYYKIPHQEIRHAGAWRGQLVYTLSNGDTTAREFDYDVKGHILDGKDVREIVVEDFETLMSQLRGMKDNAELELADLVNTAERNELERQQFYESLVEDINDLQENYQELLDTGVFQTNINEKLEELEEEYAPKLTEVTAQLAQTDNKLELKGWELQDKIKEVKPLVTFIDDDGRKEVLTKLKPLSEQYGIPFTSTVFVRLIEDETNTNYMSKEDLQHLQNDLGWEISSHTYNHPNLSTLSEEEQDFELRHSKEVLESWGLNVTTLCYPFDGRDETTYKLVRKYYRSARRTGGGINTTPLDTFEVRSTTLGSWFETPPNSNTLEYYKSRVDSAIANNGWVIFMTHVADPDHTATQQQHLEDTIKYVQEKGVEIVTYDEGLNRRGNIIDVGKYGESDYTRSHFVVGADGSISSTDLHGITRKTGANEITADIKPSKFPHGHVFSTRITTGEALNGNYPVQTGGNLKTYTTETFNAGLIYSYQEFRPTGQSEMYTRHGLSGDEWSNWVKTTGNSIVSEPNIYTNESKPSDFPMRRITYTQISNATIRAEFPDGDMGVLVTHRVATNNLYNYQEYNTANSSKVFRRKGTSSDSWGDWVDYTNHITEIGANTVTATDKAVEFPQKQVSYIRISLANATGFPEDAAGVLTTNCMFSAIGYRWQEYDIYETGGKYKRQENADGNWTEWIKLNN